MESSVVSPALLKLSPSDVQQPAQSSHAELLELSRRVDWRFLLPDPELGQVAYLGDAQPDLLRSLQSFSRSLTRLDGHNQPIEAESFDLVVIHNPTPAAIERAAELLKPGGYLYLEAHGWLEYAQPKGLKKRVKGAQSHALAYPRSVQILQAVGFQVENSHWHWPNFSACTRLIPLEGPEALQLALRSAGGIQALLRRAIAAGWVTPRQLAGFVPCYSILARKATANLTKGRENLALHFLSDQRQALALGQTPLPQALTSLVLTPRFQASSHVIYLVLAKGSPEAMLVVKVPRLAGNSPSIQREALNLSRLAAAGLADGSAPRLVAHSSYANREILVETALTGMSMSPEVVRRDSVRCCDLTSHWLLNMAVSTRRESAGSPGWFERLVQRPLEQVAGLGGDFLDLAAATRQKTAPLAELNLPLVFEHGDLSHPNLFLRQQGGIGVVDWEQAEPEGLPLCDLVFFLTYVAFSRARAQTQADYSQAYHQAFFGKQAWAMPYLWDYANHLNLPSGTLPQLLLLTWPRYLAALLGRLTSGEEAHAADKHQPMADKHQPMADKQQPATGEHQPVDWLRGNRYFALWQDTLRHFNELDGQPAGSSYWERRG